MAGFASGGLGGLAQDAGRKRRVERERKHVLRGAMLGCTIAAATLALVLLVGPSKVRKGAVESRNEAAATLLHTVLAGSSMYTAPAPPSKPGVLQLAQAKLARPPAKRSPMLEEESEAPAEGADAAAAEGETAPVEGGDAEGHAREEHTEHETRGEHDGGEEGEGELEEEEEEEEEAEAAVLVRWGFLFVTIIIVFSVAFEMGVEYIKEAVNEDMEEVVSALLEELTTLGFLGFAFFLFTVPIDDGESLIEIASIYSLHEKEALKELFEGLHYLVFFISLSFILCTIGGLATFHFTGRRQWTEFEESGVDAMTNKDLLAIDPADANYMGGLRAEWNKPNEVLRAEYLRLRCRFIVNSIEPKLESDFDFFGYMQQQVAETFSGMVKITPWDWLVTWLLLALFFGIVQEGVTAEKMLALYWYILSMIIIICLLLQCKLVWIKQQLVPRLPSELQSSARRSVHIVASPVYMDQTTIGKKEFSLADYIPAWCPTSIAKEIKHHTKVRPGNKHERLFWFSSMGPEIMSHMIRLSMFWTIISLAMLLSHHMPGVVQTGEDLTGFRIVGHVLFLMLVMLHLVAISAVYRNARYFAMCTSVEMLTNREMVEEIVREQKFAKCTKAIGMLHTLSHYMQTITALTNAEAGGQDSERSGGEAFVPKNEEEAKAFEELRELFNHYDADGSGELGKEEVGELLTTMGTNLNEEELDKLIKVMDKDGSGEIDLDELAHVMLSMKQTKKLSEVGLELFEKFDPDGSGEVSLEEMIQTFSKVGSNWDMADVENFFELIDEDKSGSVDKEEFMQFIADVEAMSK